MENFEDIFKNLEQGLKIYRDKITKDLDKHVLLHKMEGILSSVKITIAGLQYRINEYQQDAETLEANIAKIKKEIEEENTD